MIHAWSTHQRRMCIGLVQVHIGTIRMQPRFSLFYRGNRARPNEPIHLREKSCASRDSQGINNLLHSQLCLEDFACKAGMTVPRVRSYSILQVHRYYTSYGGWIFPWKHFDLAISRMQGGIAKGISYYEIEELVCKGSLLSAILASPKIKIYTKIHKLRAININN